MNKKESGVLFLVSLGLCLILPALLFADIVHTKDGRELNGKITRQGDSITVALIYGSVKLHSSDILKIIPRKTIPEQYTEKLATIEADDAEAHFQLALWCKKNRWYSKMLDELGIVTRINPDHAQAHRTLGHRKLHGEWFTKEEYMTVLGYIKFRNKWWPKEIVIELLKLDGVKKEAQARRKELRIRQELFERTQKRTYIAALYAQRIPQNGWHNNHERFRQGRFESSYTFADGSGFSVKASASSREHVYQQREPYFTAYHVNLDPPTINTAPEPKPVERIKLLNNRGHGNNWDHDDADNPGKGKGGHGAEPGLDDDTPDDEKSHKGNPNKDKNARGKAKGKNKKK